MHVLVEKYFEHQINPRSWATIDGVVFEEKHFALVEDAITLTEEILDQYSVAAIYNEQKLSVSGIKDLYGTADTVINARGITHVIDYKFGAGVEIEAIENPQLAIYGLGALEKFPNKQLIMTIVQPSARSGQKVKTWTIGDTKAFSNFWKIKFGVAIKSTEKWRHLPDNKKFVMGDHCKWCRVESVCPARINEILELFPLMEKGDTESNLEKILNSKDRIIAFLKAAEGAAIGRLQRGQRIPGWKLVKGRSLRKIINEDGFIAAAKTNYQHDESEFLQTRLRSLSTLEKLFGEEFVNRFTLKSTPKDVLVRESDGRPSIAVEKDFETI